MTWLLQAGRVGRSHSHQIIFKILYYIETLNLLANQNSSSIVSTSILIFNNKYKIGLFKKDIAQICGTTDTTLTKTARKIQKYSPLFFNDSIMEKIFNEIGIDKLY